MSEDNLYLRGGIWWLRATIRGIEVRESLRTGDVKAARRKRDARLKEVKEAIHDGRPAVSWKQAVAEWAEHELGQIAAATAKRYGVSLTQCEPILSPYLIAKIDGKVINALIASRRKNGATPATIRRDLTAVSRVLEYAEAMEWREGNPTLTKRRLLKERRDPIQLVAKAPSRHMNPALSASVVARAYERDAAVASAEYGAEFRSDLEAFASRESVEACVAAVHAYDRPDLLAGGGDFGIA
jgi:hypothetical protein